MSSGATINVSKDTSVVTGDTSEDARIKNLQPFSDAPPPITHEIVITQADSPPQESLKFTKAREPM